MSCHDWRALHFSRPSRRATLSPQRISSSCHQATSSVQLRPTGLFLHSRERKPQGFQRSHDTTHEMGCGPAFRGLSVSLSCRACWLDERGPPTTSPSRPRPCPRGPGVQAWPRDWGQSRLADDHQGKRRGACVDVYKSVHTWTRTNDLGMSAHVRAHTPQCMHAPMHPCTHAHRRAYTRAHTTHADRTPACIRTVARDNNRQADGHTWPQPPRVVGVIRSLPVGTHGLVQQFLVSLQALRGGASDNGRDRAPLGRHDLRQVQQLLVLLARPLCSGRPSVVSTPLRCSRWTRAGRAHAAHIQESTRAPANLSF